MLEACVAPDDAYVELLQRSSYHMLTRFPAPSSLTPALMPNTREAALDSGGAGATPPRPAKKLSLLRAVSSPRSWSPLSDLARLRNRMSIVCV